MTTKRLGYLLIVLAVFAALYSVFGTGSRNEGSRQAVNLLASVEGDKVERMVIQQGTESIELARKDSGWTLPQRNDYPANAERVRSLLLKLFDLSTSQLVPAGPAGIKKLGLDQEGVKSGRSLVKFFDGAGQELGGLYLGQVRAGKSDSAQLSGLPGSMTGQFVRKDGSDQVYLIAAPLTLVTSMANWLDTNLVNILRSKVLSVSQKKTSSTGAAELVFELKKPESKEAESLELQPGAAEGEEVQSAVVSQVASSLENLRITDVKPASDTDLQKLNFDQETSYQIDNGLVYHVASAQEKDKIFVKLWVDYDQELAKKLEAEANAKNAEIEKAQAEAKAAEEAKKAQEAKEKGAAAQASATPTASAEPGAAAASEPASEKDNNAADGTGGDDKAVLEATSAEQDKADNKTKEVVPEKVKVELSSVEEANKLNTKLKSWIFEFAVFQGDKFRKSRADLLKKKEDKEKVDSKDTKAVIPEEQSEKTEE